MIVDRRRAKLSVLGARSIILIAVFSGLVAWYSYLSAHAFAPNADGATVVLEGSSLLHGQPLLNGWSLSLDSFWSVDVLFYAVGVAVIGARSVLTHLVPSVLAALCVLVGLLIAWSGATNRQRIVASGMIVAALCLPGHTASYFLLQGPWHVGTTLYCLCVVLLLARPSFGYRWAIAVVLLALGLTGDFQMLALGVIPVMFAGILATLRRRSLVAGSTQVAAAAAAVVLAIVIRVVASAIGTFSVHESHHTVKFHQFVRDLGHFGDWLVALFGIHNGPVVGPSISLYVSVARGGVFVLVILGVAIALVRTGIGIVTGSQRRSEVSVAPVLDATAEPASDERERSSRIDELLVAMTLGAVALFFLLTLSNNPSYARYLDPVVLLASVLGARVLSRYVTGSRSWIQAGLASVLGVLTVIALVASIDAARTRAPASPTLALETYLAAHGLTRGLGDYWASSIVTVDTDGEIDIRPVVADLGGRIVPDGRQADERWYDKESFQFLVYERSPFGRVDRSTVLATFGPPVHSVTVGRYFVDTWSGPIVMHGRSFP